VYPNEVTDDFGTVAGGMGNRAGDYDPDSYNCWGDSSPQSAPYATVGGGLGNHAVAESATVGGGQDNWAGSMDCDGQRSIGKFATVAGGVYNGAGGQYSAIGGGYANSTRGDWTTVGGGSGNSAGCTNAYGYYIGDGAAVAGGTDNHAYGYYSFVVGGYGNEVGLAYSVSDMGGYSVVAGGYENEARGGGAAIGGGWRNTAAGWYATVPGGEQCAAKGWWSFAAGRRAKVGEEYHNGTFVWADSTDADFTSTGENQFLIRAGGGVGINTNAPAEKLHVASGNALVGGPTNFAADGDEARLNLGDGNNYVKAIRGSGLRMGAWPALDGLVLTTGGNLGIGTASPGEKLHVSAGNAVIGGPTNFAADGDEARLNLGDGNNYIRAVRGFGLRMGAWPSIDSLVLTTAGNLGIGTASPGEKLHVGAGNAVIGGPTNFAADGDEARLNLGDGNNYVRAVRGTGVVLGAYEAADGLALTNGGNVGIGTTSPSYTLHVNGSAGKPGGGSWTDSSDVRLKTNVRAISGALESVLAMRGVTYEWKDPAGHGNLVGTQIGMLAQDVEKVFPQWVGEDPQGYKTLTFRGFEALTVEALRQQQKTIDDQQAVIADLQNRVAELENLVRGLAAK
jgi:hypothetical protein